MTAADLEREFSSRAVPYPGNLLLLVPDDAVALIRRAAATGVPVLGVDGMYISARGTESPIEHIADYSDGIAAGDGCWSSAEAFVEGRRALGMVFDVALADATIPAP